LLTVPDKITPNDDFMALNQEGDELSMDEFKHLFDFLELSITETQKEQLFAFCDMDCSGKISAKEFQEGWEKMMEVFLEQAAAGQGLSTVQIFAMVAALVTILALLLFFILSALSSYSNEGSFAAISQSVLISGCGKAATALRKRAKAEEGNVDSISAGIWREQEEASTEDKAAEE